MINSQSIQMMKHGVRILNFARGDLVVNADILEALDEKNVRCYITDFPSAELLDHPGVIAIPHLGASTPESEDNCARMAAEELVDYLENGNIRNSVNLPNAEMPRSGRCRIAVIHRNQPNMISQITQMVSDAGINIENMLNKSKKDYAYTILDVNNDIDNEQLAKLSAIPDVIRVTLY